MILTCMAMKLKVLHAIHDILNNVAGSDKQVFPILVNETSAHTNIHEFFKSYCIISDGHYQCAS